jgi:2-polyprenyl-3-methyl-5-hydroxy-6-metoxy-1,4-benzoquinol methylase
MASQVESKSGDRAGRELWNSLWSSKASSREVGSPRLRHWEVQYAAFFDEAFSLLGDTRGKRILEIGAGDSGWLPYYSKRWGFEVTGLDYSPVGCERAAELAKRANVHVDLVLSDMFVPPPEIEGTFDTVVSIGVVEHYEDTARTLEALSRFLRPGGVIATIVPNIPGLQGWLFRRFNRPFYDIHVPINVALMRAAHEKAGLEVVRCNHLMSVNLGVFNIVGLDPAKLSTKLKQFMLGGFIVFSRMVWAIERVAGNLPANSFISPYVVAIARKQVA